MEEKLKHKKLYIKRQGDANSGWIILDAGEVIVHVMLEEERKFYNIDELWERYAVVYHV